jgi:hypothetical protein
MKITPNFLFIGADRCGSKSLHNMFRQHPDCYVPSIADPYFFDKNYDRGLDWYFKLFENAPPSAKAIGEFSHDYIHSAEAAQRIARDLPDVKLLVTLRHPIDRTYSSYASAYAAGVIRVPFEQAIKEVPMLLGNSMYAEKLAIYFDLFGNDRIKVLFFEDLEENPQNFAKGAFGFLGLPWIEEIDYGRRMSQLSKPRIPLAGTASKQAANLLRRLGWVQLLGKLKSNDRVRSLFYKPYAQDKKPQVNIEIRRKLRGIFEPQVVRVERMTGRNLASWRL